MNVPPNRCSPAIVIAVIVKKRPAALTFRRSRAGPIGQDHRRCQVLRKSLGQRQYLQPGILSDLWRQSFRKNLRLSAIHFDYGGQPGRPEPLQTAMEFFTSSAQPWDHVNPDLPKFPKQPKG